MNKPKPAVLKKNILTKSGHKAVFEMSEIQNLNYEVP
jgi:hypothetical protein